MMMGRGAISGRKCANRSTLPGASCWPSRPLGLTSETTPTLLHITVEELEGCMKIHLVDEDSHAKNRPWVVISPAPSASTNAVDIVVDFMDEYADVFEELAK